MPTFKIEQLALHPRDPKAAIELLTAIGAHDWAHDVVEAAGEVFGSAGENVGHLAFNYDMIDGKELEVLHYAAGPNWMRNREGVTPHRVSHLGMHCTAGELDEWRAFFVGRGIPVAQEVLTEQHSNPVIAGKRWYQYVIFDTFDILGVDLKFIVRRDHAPV